MCVYMVRMLYRQPSQNLKNLPHRDPPGAVIGVVEGQEILQTSVQALNSLLGYAER